MTVHKTKGRSNSLQCKPQQQILCAVRPINRHHLSFTYPQIPQQPVPHPLQIRKELSIRPAPVLVLEKELVGVLGGMVFEHVVEEESIRGFELGRVFHGAGGGIVESSSEHIVRDVKFGVKVSGGGGCTCEGGDGKGDWGWLVMLCAWIVGVREEG